MAKSTDQDVRLVIKAKDEASKKLKTLTKTSKEFTDANKDMAQAAVESDATMQDLLATGDALANSLEKLKSAEKQARSFKKLSNEVDATKESLERATRVFREQRDASVEAEDAVDKLTDTLLDEKAALDKLKSSKTKDIDAINKSKDAIRRYTLELREKSKESNKEARILNKTSQARDRLSAKLKRDEQALNSLSSALTKQGVDVSNLDEEYVKLAKEVDDTENKLNELNRTAKDHSKIIRKTSKDLNKYGKDIDKAGDKVDLFGDKSRKAMSVTQRFRGELLSLAAAYVGVYGAVDAVGSSFKSYNEEQAIQARLLSAFQGNQEAVNAEMAYTEDLANRLGLNLETLQTQYSKFFTSAIQTGERPEYIREIVAGTAELVSAQKLSDEQFSGVMYAMTQIMSKNQVMSEELKNQMAERIAGAVGIFAASQKKTIMETLDAMEAGTLTGETMLGFALEMSRVAAPALDKTTKSMLANFNRLKNTVIVMRREFGEMTSAESTRAMNDLTAILQGEEGIEFAQAMAEGFTLTLDAVRFLVENLDALKTVLKGLLALQAAKIFIGWAKALAVLTTTAGASKKGLAGVGLQLAALGAAYAGVDYMFDDYNSLVSDDQKINEIEGQLNKVAAVEQRYVEQRKKIIDEYKSSESLDEWTPDLGDMVAKGKAWLEGDEKFADMLDAKREEERKQRTTKYLEDLANLKKQREAALKAITKGESVEDVKSPESKKAAEEVEKRRREQTERERLARAKKLTEELEKVEKKHQSKQARSLGEQYAVIDRNHESLLGKLEKEGMVKEANALKEIIAAQKLAVLEKASHQSMMTYQSKRAAFMEDSGERLALELEQIDSEYDKLIISLEKVGKTDEARHAIALKNHAENMAMKRELDAIVKKEQEDYQKQLELIKSEHDVLDSLMERRKEYSDQIEALRASGTSEDLAKAEQIEAKMVAINEKAMAMIGPLMEQYRILGGEEGEKAIRVLTGIAESYKVIERRLISATEVNDKFADGMTDSLVEMGSGLADAIRGTGSLSDAFDRAGKAFASFAASFLIDIGKMIIKQQILSSLQGNPIAEGISASTTVVGKKHSGGLIGSGSGLTSSVLSSVFTGAKRFHTGGIIGLAPNEVPIIGETGEEVLTRDDPRHILNGGGGGNTTVQVIDQRSGDSPAPEVHRSNVDGNEQIKILIRDAVTSSMNNGELDGAMGNNYGTIRKGTKR